MLCFIFFFLPLVPQANPESVSADARPDEEGLFLPQYPDQLVVMGGESLLPTLHPLGTACVIGHTALVSLPFLCMLSQG